MTGSDGHLLSRDGRHHSRIMIQNNDIWTVDQSIPMQKYANGTMYGWQNTSSSVNDNVPSIMAHTGHVSTPAVEKQLSTQTVQGLPQQFQKVPLSLQQFQPTQQQCRPSQQLLQPELQWHPSRPHFQSSVHRSQSFQKQSSNKYLQPMPSQFQTATPQLQNTRMQFQPYQHQVQTSRQPIQGPVKTNAQVLNGQQPLSKEVSTSGLSIIRQNLTTKRTDESQNDGVSKTAFHQLYTSSDQWNIQHGSNGYRIGQNHQNQTSPMPTATSSRSNGNQNKINENQFASSPTNTQNISTQPMTMQELLKIRIFSEYYNAAINGRQYLETFQKNFKKPQYNSASNPITVDDDINDSPYVKIYEKTFNVANNQSAVNEEQQAMMNWYKEPSQVKTTEELKDRKRKHSISDTDITDVNDAKSPRLDNRSTGAQSVEIVAHNKAESLDQRRGVMNSKDQSNTSFVPVENVRSAETDDYVPKDLGVAAETSSDVENNHDLKTNIQREKSDSDGSIMEFMDVMSVSSPQFYIYFHGRKILCLSKQNRKYVLLRELIFHFFKDTIAVVKTTLLALGIAITLLSGKEKNNVSRYLLHQKIYSDKTTKNVGIIQLEDAIRLYHKLCTQMKCDICVKLADKKTRTEATASASATSSNYHSSLPIPSPPNTKSEKRNPKEVSSKQVTALITEDCDSDSTLLYDDNEEEEREQLIQIPNRQHIYEENGLIIAGIIELGGNLVRYICRKAIHYVPIKDIKKHFSTDVISETLERIACRTTKCREIEQGSFLQFDIGLDEIVQGDVLVDSRILEHIYLVASEMNPTIEDDEPSKKILLDAPPKDDNVITPDNDSGDRYKAMFKKFTSFCKQTMNRKFSRDEHG